jgi:hypothetical protein
MIRAMQAGHGYATYPYDPLGGRRDPRQINDKDQKQFDK